MKEENKSLKVPLLFAFMQKNLRKNLVALGFVVVIVVVVIIIVVVVVVAVVVISFVVVVIAVVVIVYFLAKFSKELPEC